MNRRTVVSLGAFATLMLGGSARAQATSRRPAAKPVRTGVSQSAPPAQPVVVNTTGLPMVNAPAAPVQPPTGAQPAFLPTPGIAQITYYPTVVLANGRVLANFGTGRGYEEVLRQCPQISGALPPNAVIAPCFTVDAYGTYRVMQRR
jgi:hypothetical protein